MMQTTFVALLVLAALGCSHGSPLTEVFQESREVKPVNLTMYYECKCESCGYFIVDQVAPTWKLLEDTGIFRVYFIPYGNTKETKVGDKYNFTCQHGQDECDGNLVETCTLHYFPMEKDHMDFFSCFEDKFDFGWEKIMRECADVAKFPADKVEDIASCVRGDLGNKLQHQMGLRTGPHDAVPWILIDGVVTWSAEDDLLTPVCNAYKGTKPDACKK